MRTLTCYTVGRLLDDGSTGHYRRCAAATPHDAVARYLRRTGARPSHVFVALGPERHPSGIPMTVQRYALTWGERP